MARKFKLPTFRKIVAPEIFVKGRNIFEKGGVTNLKKQGNEWAASVEGRDKSYAVSVSSARTKQRSLTGFALVRRVEQSMQARDRALFYLK